MPSENVLLLLFIFCSAALATKASMVTVTTQTVFSNTSRFPYDHMTMIERITDDIFILCWQSSHIGEGSPDQRIVMSRSFDGGQSWSRPEDIIFGDNVPVWGPALIYQKATDTLFMYYAASVSQNIRPPSNHHFPGGEITLRTSQDLGASWSNPVVLMRYDSHTRGNVSKMTANKPIFLSQDQQSWGLPFWQEPHVQNHNDTGVQCAGLLITYDSGKTHTPYGCIKANGTWVIENSAVPLTQLHSSRLQHRPPTSLCNSCSERRLIFCSKALAITAAKRGQMFLSHLFPIQIRRRTSLRNSIPHSHRKLSSSLVTPSPAGGAC